MRGLQQTIRGAQAKLSEFAGENYQANLQANVNPVLAAIRAAKRSLASFAGENYEANLGADSSSVRSAVRAAQRAASGFAGESYEATLGADYGDVRTAVAAAERMAASFARETYEATLGARGAVETIAEVKAVDSAADRVDGRNVNLDINADESGIRSLGDSFKSLASNIRATGTILAAASIPFAIAGIGAATPTILALTASLGGLTIALGSGLVGAAVAASGALGTLAGAFALIAAPVKLLLGSLKEYDTSLDSVSSAQDAAKSAAQSYASAQLAVSDAQKNLARTTADAGRAIKEAEQGVSQARQEGASAILEAERSLAEARRTGTQDIQQAEQALADARLSAARSVADAERSLGEARRSASESTAQAEGDLEDARDTLASATRSLTDAQEELNRALRDEPLNQREATLDLADARDRASDAQRDYNSAVREFGRNSEEATDARRELQRANLELLQTEREVRDTRRQGSDELQSAREGVKSAYDEQRTAAEGVRDSEAALNQARVEGFRQISDAQREFARTQADATSSVALAQQALRQSRAEAVRGEKEAQRALVEAHKQASQQIREAEQAVAEARRQGARQIADANAQVVASQRAANLALQALREAQKGVSEQTVKLTKDQKALYNEYQRFKTLGDSAFLGAQNASARLGVQILKLAESYLPALGRASKATILALTRSFETFRSELARPVEQAGITRYLQLIPKFTEAAATAAGHLGLALFNVFTRSLRYVMPLTRGIGDLTQRFLRFTESASGRNSIDHFFAAAVERAKQFGRVIMNVGRGFFNVFDAINQAGLADQAVRGLQSLASGFVHVTRRGSEAREKMNGFLNDTRRLMPHVGDAVLAFVSQIGRVANVLINAREQGHRLTILESIFRGIQRAAKPVGDLLIGTFRDLGPEIAKLIPRLTRFFGVFAGSSGPLVTFVRLINRALAIFNRLPASVKSVAANLLALKIILGGLGLGAVVGGLGRFASNAFLAARATRKIRPELAASAGQLTLFGASAGKGGAKAGFFARMLTRAKSAGRLLIGGLGAVVTFLTGPWGIAIAAAVTAGILIYKNWGRITKAAGPLIKAFRSILADVRPLARTMRGALLSAIGAVAKGFLSAISPGLKLKDVTGGLANALKGLASRVLPVVTRAVRAFDGWVKRNKDTLFAIGKVVGTVLVTGFRIWYAVLRTTIAILGKLFQAVKFGISVFRGLVGAVMSAAKAIGGAFGGAATKVAEVIENIKDKWKALPDWLKQAGKDAAWGFIKGFTGVGIAGALIDKVSGAIDSLKKDNKGNSPWGSTMALGRDAAAGFAMGLLQDGGAVEKNARAMGERARDALRDGIVNLGEVPRSVWNRLMRQGWKGHPGDRAERLYRPHRAAMSGAGHPDTRYWNSRTDPNRGKPGYTMAEDGSWVPKSFYGGHRRRRPGGSDSFAANARSDPNAGRPGYVQTEDGTWVPKSFYGRGGRRSGGTSAAMSGRSHRGITKDEMDEVLGKHSDKQLKVIRAAAAQMAASPEFMRFLDAAMSGSFNHLTGMKADVR